MSCKFQLYTAGSMEFYHSIDCIISLGITENYVMFILKKVVLTLKGA